jgi:serine/threonine protein kinase
MTAVLVVTRRRRHADNDWEINFDELELGPQLGTGGYGEVHQAMWKGTEVAVKMMTDSGEVTRDMEKSFKDEVRPAGLLLPAVDSVLRVCIHTGMNRCE